MCSLSPSEVTRLPNGVTNIQCKTVLLQEMEEERGSSEEEEEEEANAVAAAAASRNADSESYRSPCFVYY